MELDTLAENADFDDVDDNDFGEVLGGDEERKLDIGRFAKEMDLALINGLEREVENSKEDVDNSDDGLKVIADQVMKEDKKDESGLYEWKSNELLPEDWIVKPYQVGATAIVGFYWDYIDI